MEEIGDTLRARSNARGRVHYRAQYAENDESVSNDSHISDATFAYSLSPAATWKGPIGKGKIEINILHAEPEDVSIAKPKEHFQKASDTHYEWQFEILNRHWRTTSASSRIQNTILIRL